MSLDTRECLEMSLDTWECLGMPFNAWECLVEPGDVCYCMLELGNGWLEGLVRRLDLLVWLGSGLDLLPSRLGGFVLLVWFLGLVRVRVRSHV